MDKLYSVSSGETQVVAYRDLTNYLQGSFVVYQEDSEGNGDLLNSFEEEKDARFFADLYARYLDKGQRTDTDEYHAMRIFVRAKGLQD